MKKYIILLVTMFAFMISGCCPQSSCNTPPSPRLKPVSYTVLREAYVEMHMRRAKGWFSSVDVDVNQLYKRAENIFKDDELYFYNDTRQSDYGKNYQYIMRLVNYESISGDYYVYQLVTN